MGAVWTLGNQVIKSRIYLCNGTLNKKYGMTMCVKWLLNIPKIITQLLVTSLAGDITKIKTVTSPVSDVTICWVVVEIPAASLNPEYICVMGPKIKSMA